MFLVATIDTVIDYWRVAIMLQSGAAFFGIILALGRLFGLSIREDRDGIDRRGIACVFLGFALCLVAIIDEMWRRLHSDWPFHATTLVMQGAVLLAIAGLWKIVRKSYRM
jgi:hypothetical protein